MKIANFFYTNGNTSWHHKFTTICVAPPLSLGVVSVDVKNHYIVIVYWLFKGAQELGLASILEQFVACYSYWLCERDPPSNLLLIIFFPDFAPIYTKTLLAMRNDPFMSSHESTPGHNWPTILDGGHCKAPKSYRPGPGYKATRNSFGASVFHVLRMCTGVRKLQLTLAGACRLEVILPYSVCLITGTHSYFLANLGLRC
jgi:hypothetical protein